ncbi:MAG: response regulator transcription factor [Synergistaceae bacterium]|jgi:DNA-binding response OmpR family regulator|nr:response regulator transcription factor [Synergistaceae bacterium]
MPNIDAIADSDIRLMIADMDSSVRDIIRYSVRDEGWACDEAKDGIALLKLLRRREYNLIVLEAELPEISGDMVCKQIRKSSRVPVIFLGRGASEEERLNCFAAGGNDFVQKPFFPREMLARMKSFLSLSGAAATKKMLNSGSLRIETYSHSVFIEGREIKLTPREYDLLLFFCRNPNKAFSREEILDLVWGKHFFGTDRTVDTHVKSLRSKIRPYHVYISTIWGYGYKYDT